MEIYLDHIKGEREGALDRFSSEVIRVGRNPEFELCFEDLGVSYEHAELRKRDDAYWVMDRDSTNGTYVNEERAHNARLKDGDVLRFGKKGPIVRFRTSEGDPLLAERAKPAPKPASVVAAPPMLPGEGAPIPALDGARRRGTARYEALRPDDDDPEAPEPPPPASMSGPVSSDLQERRGGERSAAPAARGSWLPIALGLALLVSAGITIALWLELERRDSMARQAADASHAKVKQLEETAQALERRLAEEKAQEQAALSEWRLKAEQREGELQRARADARRQETDAREKTEELERKIARLSGEIAALSQRSNDTSAWKVIQKRLKDSVVLISVSVDAKGRDGRTIIPIRYFGTGFFVTKDGLIATNKHVVEPWKFRELAQRMAMEGLEIIPDSYVCTAWIAGTRFMTFDKKLDYMTGYTTKNGSLERVRTAPDRWISLPLPGEATGPRMIKVHDDQSNDDLALLRAKGGGPFEPIPLRRAQDGAVEKLDNVMVLGFPAGPNILEKGMAEPSPSTGTVRKVEETIYVTASLIGGNSGGPLIDSEGRAIGVATRVIQGGGSEGLGSCLKIEHVINLVEGGSW